MDLREILGCLVLLLGGFSLLQFSSLLVRKIGMGFIWLATGLGVYFLTSSIFLSIAMLLAWIFFPVWEMFFVLRQLRVPRRRELTDAPAPREEFEELAEMTRSLAELEFDKIDECRMRPAQHEQYYRLFVRRDGLGQATIGYVAQGSIGFHFLAFSSQGPDGRYWITWDYPLTYGLVMPPTIAVFRALDCETVQDLHNAHLDFLQANAVAAVPFPPEERTREGMRARLAQTLDQQIEYNISCGYLMQAAGSDPANFCYSWRGIFFVAGRVLRDLFF